MNGRQAAQSRGALTLLAANISLTAQRWGGPPPSTTQVAPQVATAAVA
jgi:hypothetical protein